MHQSIMNVAKNQTEQATGEGNPARKKGRASTAKSRRMNGLATENVVNDSTTKRKALHLADNHRTVERRGRAGGWKDGWTMVRPIEGDGRRLTGDWTDSRPGSGSLSFIDDCAV
ncbi:hypothetical protein Mp_7g07430 [Marchantia polymorpha subsp. ruderalis]|uniref:Uncharacterized protein n=2 Tax=Marchantia polymorpha TaxID=3197 RepID=A0AAF6BX33_MARPO|nr:hypothetical protein MARPO_0076s0051 [Marchantia polymorpha]BBN16567.1 hypothetical protein Mp_7g07430 [Marchantia polymorpha subsp. ruderalis]|eukprot:PTQ34811.1 hypothetical protein MARPO_0076s0051 [Marchantia polymorpha]